MVKMNIHTIQEKIPDLLMVKSENGMRLIEDYWEPEEDVVLDRQARCIWIHKKLITDLGLFDVNCLGVLLAKRGYFFTKEVIQSEIVSNGSADTLSLKETRAMAEAIRRLMKRLGESNILEKKKSFGVRMVCDKKIVPDNEEKLIDQNGEWYIYGRRIKLTKVELALIRGIKNNGKQIVMRIRKKLEAQGLDRDIIVPAEKTGYYTINTELLEAFAYQSKLPPV